MKFADPLFNFVRQKWFDHTEHGTEESGLVYEVDPTHL